MTDRDDLERLLEEQLAEFADQIVARVVAELDAREARARASGRRPDPAEPLVDTATLARYLAVRENYVRAHADQLRVRRVSRSALRFSLGEVDELLLREGERG